MKVEIQFRGRRTTTILFALYKTITEMTTLLL
jgi:hypothetical protein